MLIVQYTVKLTSEKGYAASGGMDIKQIQEQGRQGHWLAKPDCYIHPVKEDFEVPNIVETVLSRRVIEEYPERKRVPICDTTALRDGRLAPMHDVSEFSDPTFVEFVTAYIPDETVWARPPYRRRKRRR